MGRGELMRNGGELREASWWWDCRRGFARSSTLPDALSGLGAGTWRCTGTPPHQVLRCVGVSLPHILEWSLLIWRCPTQLLESTEQASRIVEESLDRSVGSPRFPVSWDFKYWYRFLFLLRLKCGGSILFSSRLPSRRTVTSPPPATDFRGQAFSTSPLLEPRNSLPGVAFRRFTVDFS